MESLLAMMGSVWQLDAIGSCVTHMVIESRDHCYDFAEPESCCGHMMTEPAIPSLVPRPKCT